MIKSRYLQHLGEFQESIKTKDAAGETVETWQTVFTRFVDVRPLGVSTSEDESSNYQVARLELSVRYSRTLQDAITTNHRVLIDSKPYRIDEIGDVFSKQKLTYLISLYE